MLDHDSVLRTTVGAVIIAAFALGTGLTSKAAAQSETQTALEVSAALSANDRLAQLGPEGEALEKRVGTWDVIFTNWEKPGAAPTTTGDLVAEREMIGPMLQERLHTAPGAPGRAWTRIDDLTFNRVTSRWDYMSMDTRAAVGLMPAWSLDCDPADHIFVSFVPFALAGDGTNVTGQLLQMEQIIIKIDPDHETKDQYFLPADGNGTKWLAKRYSYTRK